MNVHARKKRSAPSEGCPPPKIIRSKRKGNPRKKREMALLMVICQYERRKQRHIET